MPSVVRDGKREGINIAKKYRKEIPVMYRRQHRQNNILFLWSIRKCVEKELALTLVERTVNGTNIAIKILPSTWNCISIAYAENCEHEVMILMCHMSCVFHIPVTYILCNLFFFNLFFFMYDIIILKRIRKSELLSEPKLCRAIQIWVKW
jgi:hypothetical protein